MDKVRNMQLIVFLSLALQEIYSEHSRESKTKQNLILLTCQYGKNYNVKHEEVENILDKSIAQLFLEVQ